MQEGDRGFEIRSEGSDLPCHLVFADPDGEEIQTCLPADGPAIEDSFPDPGAARIQLAENTPECSIEEYMRHYRR
jgi:hypothetical protein